MSAAMARKGGGVQVDQSNKRLTMNITKMAQVWYLCTAIEEMQNLINKPCTNVREEEKWGVEFPAYKHVKAAIATHPAMVHNNQTDGCFPCLNVIVINLHTGWRCKGTGVPLP
jgi:hypothetical protein